MTLAHTDIPLTAYSLPKTVTRQRRGCDLNPGPTVPESSTLTPRLLSHREANPRCVKADLDR